MKRTNTQVEETSETVTKIACDQCGKRHDNRRDRGKRGLQTLMLDAVPQKKSGYSYSEWRDRKWGSRRSFRDNKYRIKAAATVDYCVEPCFDRVFLDPEAHQMDAIDRQLQHSIEVEETEYDVVERDEDEYLCDRCGDSMGTEHDHTVSLNPRLKVYEDTRVTIASRREEPTEIATRSANEIISGPRRNKIKPIRDSEFHVCSGCAKELFHLGAAEKTRGFVGGVAYGTASCFTSMCKEMKSMFFEW